MRNQISLKHILIDKANNSIVALVAIAASSLVFASVFGTGLTKQITHRNKVIAEKQKAAKIYKTNTKAIEDLVKSFKQFDEAPESVLGTKDPNAKIVLDSLPSKYDFPALATSLEKVLTEGGYTITSLTGVDDELNAEQKSAVTPVPISMPFSLGISGSYDKVIQVVSDLERSIRPIQVDYMTLSGTASNAQLTIQARTYYQPGRSLENKTKEVK